MKKNLITIVFAICPAYFGLFVDGFIASIFMILGLVALTLSTAAAVDESEHRPMLKTAWITFVLNAYVLVAIKHFA